MTSMPLRLFKKAWTLCLGVALAHSHMALAESPEEISFSAYVDTYYAHDFNHLPTRYRPYTTQPYYTDEAALNLGYVDTKVDTGTYHGRLAVQYGSSVIANYAGEPHEFFRYLQEAYAGIDVSKRLVIDAGSFFSHIGMETWISRDNYTPSRSLMADYSPYYQTGARAIYQVSDAMSAQLHLVRGWQNMSDNADPALGTQLSYSTCESLTLTHNTLITNVHGTRVFNNFIVDARFTPAFGIKGSYDLGIQERRDESTALWRGWAIIPHYTINDTFAVAGRVEQFYDPHGVVLQSLSGLSFDATGLSVNLDTTLTPGLVWRNEYRVFMATNDVFPRREEFSGSDSFVGTSLQWSIS
jgi:hypothetical protein